MTVTIVVAMGADGVIGVDGDMPWHLPADLANFKAVTLGHPIIMGRKTYDSIGRPLPGRTTIVVTHQTDWAVDGVLVAAEIDAALSLALALDPDVFIIGGAQIYAEALGRGVVDRLLVTHVGAAPEGDTYFPNVDWDSWVETNREEFANSMPRFAIATYQRP